MGGGFVGGGLRVRTRVLRGPAPVEIPMDRYSRTDLADASVLHNLKSNDATNRSSLADLLADLGELDERQLWRNVAYSSLHEYCTVELNWTEDEAYKRVRVAQVARQFPAIFQAIADDRLNPRGVLLLPPRQWR